MRTSARPLVTVITAALNADAGLRRTWASLASQGDAAFEWVVVDGGSTDGGVEWLRQLDDPRVSWSSGPDAGIYDAMNKGICSARGEILVFLGAGDRLTPGALALVSSDWAERGWMWAYGLSRVVDEGGELVQVANTVPFRRRWLELGYRALNHQACYFSRDLVQKLGGYDVNFAIFADQEFCIRAASIAPPRVLGSIVAEFVVGGVSWSLPAGAMVWPARRMRRKANRYVAQNSAVDLVVASLVWMDLRVRNRVARMFHSAI